MSETLGLCIHERLDCNICPPAQSKDVATPRADELATINFPAVIRLTRYLYPDPSLDVNTASRFYIDDSGEREYALVDPNREAAVRGLYETLKYLKRHVAAQDVERVESVLAAYQEAVKQ